MSISATIHQVMLAGKVEGEGRGAAMRLSGTASGRGRGVVRIAIVALSLKFLKKKIHKKQFLGSPDKNWGLPSPNKIRATPVVRLERH